MDTFGTMEEGGRWERDSGVTSAVPVHGPCVSPRGTCGSSGVPRPATWGVGGCPATVVRGVDVHSWLVTLRDEPDPLISGVTVIIWGSGRWWRYRGLRGPGVGSEDKATDEVGVDGFL